MAYADPDGSSRMKPKGKRSSRTPSKAGARQKKKPARGAATDAWLKRLSPKAQERIRREGYHLPNRSEREQVQNLSEELQEAWSALKSHLLGLGEQEMRTSHRSIMFARKTCYAFARPKKAHIELNFFLPQALDSEFLAKVTPVSRTKWVHVLRLTHSDQVDRPLTDWIRQAYEHSA
jgi:hypothetical protein